MSMISPVQHHYLEGSSDLKKVHDNHPHRQTDNHQPFIICPACRCKPAAEPNTLYRELKTARGHFVYPQQHLSNGIFCPPCPALLGLVQTTRCSDKLGTLFLFSLSQANVDRFSIFHQVIRKKILYVYIIKISTSPAKCCYTTLWKSKIQKICYWLDSNSTNSSYMFLRTLWGLYLIFSSS